MGRISNSQSFETGASGVIGSTDVTAFKTSMDGVMIDMGRDIDLHLPPQKNPCTDPDCKFDSFYKRYVSTTGQVCQTCTGRGFIIEPLWTTYRANIRWTNEPYNEKGQSIVEHNPIGRLGANFARTKTVATSFDHIKDSIGATIDGVNVELFQEPRYTGFGGQLLYVIAWWKVVNR